MDDTARTLLILEGTGTRLGFVRFDRRDAVGTANFEVSVAVDPAHHGRGLGAAALALARRFAPGAALDATVLPANLASQALFASAGYEQIGPYLFRSLPN
jgi:RimJ/RimL family protein N-acetyltransferase